MTLNKDRNSNNLFLEKLLVIVSTGPSKDKCEGKVRKAKDTSENVRKSKDLRGNPKDSKRSSIGNDRKRQDL
jgi:hypothetical protein